MAIVLAVVVLNLLVVGVVYLAKRETRRPEPPRDALGIRSMCPFSGVTLTLDGESAYVVLGHFEDDKADWLIQVYDRRGKGPPPANLLPIVDQALRSLKGVRDIRWHPRQAFERGDMSAGKPAPLD